MVFTATVRPMTGSTALYTIPMAPRPSSPTISYLPALVTVSIFKPDSLSRTRVRGHPGALLGTVTSGISIGQRYRGTSVSHSILGWLDRGDVIPSARGSRGRVPRLGIVCAQGQHYRLRLSRCAIMQR